MPPDFFKNKKILIITLFFLLENLSFAQMPDWTLIIDKDSNKYYIDKNEKIWTSGEPEFDYKPVSVEGLDFYLNQGIELIKNSKKMEGLLLLKTIKVLPVKNNLTHKAQVQASREINRLSKAEGIRFKELNKKASLLLFKDNNVFFLIDDEMLYSIKSSYIFKILSKRTRTKTNYNYTGLLLGFRFHEEPAKNSTGYPGYSQYDLLLAIESERFPGAIKNAADIENHWKKRLGADAFERTSIKRNNNQILNTYNHAPLYSGFEGYYSKNNSGYYLRAITSKALFLKYKAQIMDIANGFKLN